MKKLIIYGTGSHASLVYAYFAKDPAYQVAAFTVERVYLNENHFFGLPVLPFEDVEKYISPFEADMFIAVGPFKQNSILERYCRQAEAKGYGLASYFPQESKKFFIPEYSANSFTDHASQFHPYVTMGKGTTLIASQLGHHAQIGNYVFVSTAIIGGNVVVEDYVFIGIGAVIKQGVRIGKGSFIGMGCVITKDVAPYAVYSVRGTKCREGLDARRLHSF